MPPLLLCGFWESEFSSPCFHRKYLIHWAISLILFIFMSYMCIHSVCMSIHIWRSEINITCLPLLLSTVYFETGSFTEFGSHWLADPVLGTSICFHSPSHPRALESQIGTFCLGMLTHQASSSHLPILENFERKARRNTVKIITPPNVTC